MFLFQRAFFRVIYGLDCQIFFQMFLILRVIYEDRLSYVYIYIFFVFYYVVEWVGFSWFFIFSFQMFSILSGGWCVCEWFFSICVVLICFCYLILGFGGFCFYQLQEVLFFVGSVKFYRVILSLSSVGLFQILLKIKKGLGIIVIDFWSVFL